MAQLRSTQTRLLAATLIFSPLAFAGGSGPPAYEVCTPVSYGAATQVTAPLKSDGRYFKDNAGNVILLRGVNATGDAKMPPYRPLADVSLLNSLQSRGINTLRLLFNWEAFEPDRCDYDQSYLDYYENIVTAAEARGLYVIVDFHQDAYSRYNIDGCGEGFPGWAVTSAITKKTPDNSAATCSGWGVKMIFDSDHHTTWSHFHSNREGARDRYVDMVKAVAERMSDHGNVIGYELINEPWGNDTELASLYEAVGAAIRSRHPNTILFVPPHALVSSGTPDNNIAKPTFTNFVYSPHYYDGNVLLLKNWMGGSVATPLNKMLNKANGWSVPMILSEYGAPAETQNASGYMEALNTWLDANFVSGTQWSWTPGWTWQNKDGWNGEDLSIVDDSGALRTQLYLPRPYPQKTAGTPVSFQRTSAGFSYRWQNKTTLGTTSIFLPSGYAAGKTVTTSSGTSCSVSGQKLNCQSTQNAEVSVTLATP
jgi:endoglycosylceramidase